MARGKGNGSAKSRSAPKRGDRASERAEPEEPAVKVEKAKREEEEEDGGDDEEDLLFGLTFFVPGDPNGKTLTERNAKRVGPQRQLELKEASNTLDDFLKALGEAAMEKARKDWGRYLEAIMLCRNGNINVTAPAEAAVALDSKGKPKGRPRFSASSASTMQHPHVQQGIPWINEEVAKADKDIMAANICHDVKCTHKRIEERSCYIKAQDSSKHLLLDQYARWAWATALIKKVTGVTNRKPPRLPPFTDFESSAGDKKVEQNAGIEDVQKAEEDKVFISFEDSSDVSEQEYEIVKTEYKPKPKEKGKAENAQASKAAGRRGKGKDDSPQTSKAAGSRVPLKQIVNNTPQKRIADVPTAHPTTTRGPRITLDEMAARYGIDAETLEKLKGWKATTPEMVANMSDAQLRDAGLEKGEPLMVKTAIESWRLDGPGEPSSCSKRPRVAIDSGTTTSDAGSSHVATPIASTSRLPGASLNALNNPAAPPSALPIPPSDPLAALAAAAAAATSDAFAAASGMNAFTTAQ